MASICTGENWKNFVKQHTFILLLNNSITIEVDMTKMIP